FDAVKISRPGCATAFARSSTLPGLSSMTSSEMADLRAVGIRGFLSQQTVDLASQHIQPDGLGDVTGKTSRQCQFTVTLQSTGGEGDHRRLPEPLILPEFFDHAKTVQPRHVQVEDDEVGQKLPGHAN